MTTEKLRREAFVRLTGETHPNWEAEIMRQLDNVETLHRIGVDYKAVVPDDRVKGIIRKEQKDWVVRIL